MEKLSTKNRTRKIVEKYGFDFRKRFGQNFLVDEQVILRMLNAAQVGKDDIILEIGPGIGTLTQYLSEAAGHVTAIEIDRNLIPILQETLEGYDNVNVLHADVLKVDFDRLLCSEEITAISGGDNAYLRQHLKIVANLPYYITTPILMQLFEMHLPAKSITVLVQKEVAQRMEALPGTKEYGMLSLAVQYYAKTDIAVIVPPSSFMPPPEVTSAVISLEIYPEDQMPCRAQNEKMFFAVVKAAFEQRRKTLTNALGSKPQIPVDKKKVGELLEEMGKIPTVRGETLTLAEFVTLSDLVNQAGESGDDSMRQ